MLVHTLRLCEVILLKLKCRATMENPGTPLRLWVWKIFGTLSETCCLLTQIGQLQVTGV